MNTVKGASLGVSKSSPTMPLREISNFLADVIELYDSYPSKDRKIIETGRDKKNGVPVLRIYLSRIQALLMDDRLKEKMDKLHGSVAKRLPAWKGANSERVLWGGITHSEEASSERTALLRLYAAVRKLFGLSVKDEFLRELWDGLKYADVGAYQTKEIAFSPPYHAPFSAEIARQVTAKEMISGDHTRGLLNGLRAKLLESLPDGDEDGQDDIEDALDSWRDQAGSPGSIMSGFIETLSDIAPSRARLHISIEILEAYCSLARREQNCGQKYSNFLSYATRLILYYRYFCQYGNELKIYFPTREEDGFDFQFNSLSLSLYASLPIWFKLDDQISEIISKNLNAEQQEVSRNVREISYIPRLNGIDRINKKSSYENMVYRTGEEWEGHNNSWRLTRLFLLWVLTNRHESGNPELHSTVGEVEKFFTAQADEFSNLLNSYAIDAEAPIQKRQDSLKKGVGLVVNKLLNSSITSYVRRAADELLALLRTDRSRKSAKGCQLNRFLDNEKISIYVNVLDSVVDPQCLKVASKHPFSEKNLTRSDLGRFLLKSVFVSKSAEIPNALYAYRIDYAISERSLRSKKPSPDRRFLKRGDSTKFYERVLISLTPGDLKKPNSLDDYKELVAQWRCDSKESPCPAPAIALIYNSSDLDMPSDKQPVDNYQSQSITSAIKKMCFTVLSYMILRHLVMSLKETKIKRENTTDIFQMLKITSHGIDSATGTGADTFYAAFKAIEIALSSQVRIKAQGFNASDDRDENIKFYKKKGTLNALNAAYRVELGIPFPLLFNKTGIIDYEIRPSEVNAHGEVLSYVSVVRTYIAQRSQDNTGNATLILEHGRNFINVDRTDDLSATQSNTAVKKALDMLIDKLGCETVLLIGRQHGDRRIGRAEDRHRKADPEKFLQVLRSTYPRVRIIPLVRKRSLVLRLKGQRNSTPIAYEIVGAQDHASLTSGNYLGEEPAPASLSPIYSVATLHVVGDEHWSPRSGLTTYSWLQGPTVPNCHYTDALHRAREVLIDGSAAQKSLCLILRSLHYIETERSPKKNGGSRLFLPLLNPFNAKSTAEMGEIEITQAHSNMHMGSLHISGPALFSRINDVLEADETKKSDGQRSDTGNSYAEVNYDD
ncbi:hypothetical protein [Acetobacter pasteurianus]|uniref:Uncharacterized protein n=1 Tax=Acetobacter pasteurianus NBRC 3188 TaxID=1226663 RepID=A0A401WY02_ACEPA|nr:hypothetical protein [Acetobacter pasteurianus]GCD54080.1 hypothetical protein NBRC3188_2777 [Acetobacter pasteurianus NBRC 3188]